MQHINGAQIRGARGLLNWTQDNLADRCQISRRTIRLIENDYPVRVGNVRKIQETLKDNGVEFLNDHGVKLQTKDVRIFSGTNSCDEFFAYVTETLKHKGSGMCCIIPKQVMLTQQSGYSGKTNIERLEIIQKITPVKCLLADSVEAHFLEPKFDVRALPEDPYIMPAAIFSFGCKRVLGFFDTDPASMTFVIIDECKPEQSEHVYFLLRWKIAKPAQFDLKGKKRRP